MAGLGLVPGRAVRLREGRVPRIGWAPVEPSGETYWFAHSYAAETDAAVATSEGIVAIVESGSFLGVQFHPEKSGAAGQRVPGEMPLPRLIPCLDVAAGRVVKGIRFRELRDVGDPVELGAAYSDAGADELVFLDVSATLEDARLRRPGRRARRRARVDPVHGRRRHPLGRGRRRSPGGGRRQDLRQLGGARAARADHASSRAPSARRRSSSRSTPRRAASTRTLRPATPSATRSSGRASARSAAPASCSSRRSTATARRAATTSSCSLRCATRCRCR